MNLAKICVNISDAEIGFLTLERLLLIIRWLGCTVMAFNVPTVVGMTNA
jgi:hypothetical protein